MSLKARCGNCNAWLKSVRNGICRARSPQVILLGMQQAPGVALPGLRTQAQASPVTMTVFPEMKENGWCRQWEPVAELEGAFLEAANGKQAEKAERDEGAENSRCQCRDYGRDTSGCSVHGQAK